MRAASQQTRWRCRAGGRGDALLRDRLIWAPDRSGATERKEAIMAKKISGYIKLQVPAGTANPSPPLGPALGQRGVNIMEFCKAFNAATDSLDKGTPTPTIITVFADKSFSFVTKNPPATDRKGPRLNSSH